MNVLNITSCFPLYDGHSAGPFTLEEARELTNLGKRQIVLTQHYKGSSYLEFIDSIEVHRFKWFEPAVYTRIREMTDISHLPHLISYFISAITGSLDLTKRKKIDVIYAQWSIPSGLVGVIVSMIRKLPLVIVIHGADVLGAKPQKFPFKSINRWVFKHASKILARGEYLYERINEIYGMEFEDKLINIPIGLDVKDFDQNISDAGVIKAVRESIAAAGRPIVLTVRHLSPNYQLEHLFTTIKMYNNIAENSRPMFVIIGGGTVQYTENLKKLVEDLGIDEDVVFLGAVEHKEIAKYISACDVFVDPAIGGQGVACLEAMSLAKPAIGFHQKGTAVKIENGKSGYLVEFTSPLPACLEMAHKIKDLLENEMLRYEMGESASSMVSQNYQISITAKKVADLLDGLVRKR